MAYASKHRDDDAATELRQVLPPSRPEESNGVLGLLGLVLARQGHMAEARDILRTLQRNSHKRYTSPYGEALVQLGLGEKDRALTLLERATDEHYPWIVHFNVNPALDPLRGEPRFEALLRRTGIPHVTRASQTGRTLEPSVTATR